MTHAGFANRIVAGAVVVAVVPAVTVVVVAHGKAPLWTGFKREKLFLEKC